MAQIIKLGLSGAETTLNDESRIFSTSGNSLNSVEGRTADGSLRVDFISNIKSFTINYSVISEVDKDITTELYQYQIKYNTALSFIYTNQSGSPVMTTVYMEAPSFGATIINGVYYYSGVTINMTETQDTFNATFSRLSTSDNYDIITSNGDNLIVRIG